MSFFPVCRISGWAGRSPWAPFGLFVSCCQLVCWPVDWNMPAVLTLLADWRHTMPSSWFMTSVARWRSCCETPLPSVSIWGVPECFFFLAQGSRCVFRLWPSRRSRLFRLPFAEFASCSSLTASIDCVSVRSSAAFYDRLLGCHRHRLTPRASSELVILSICPPTARVINIWVTVQNAPPGVPVAHFAHNSPSTPVLLSENTAWCVNVMEKMQLYQKTLSGLFLLAAARDDLLKSARAKIASMKNCNFLQIIHLETKLHQTSCWKLKRLCSIDCRRTSMQHLWTVLRLKFSILFCHP